MCLHFNVHTAVVAAPGLTEHQRTPLQPLLTALPAFGSSHVLNQPLFLQSWELGPDWPLIALGQGSAMRFGRVEEKLFHKSPLSSWC